VITEEEPKTDNSYFASWTLKPSLGWMKGLNGCYKREERQAERQVEEQTERF
jgi:hypothetical protein